MNFSRTSRLAILSLAACAGSAQADDLAFKDCMAGLRTQAMQSGIGGDSFDQYTVGLQPDLGVLDLLDAQPEFTTPIWDYLAALVDEQRITDGQTMLTTHAATLSTVS
ncbi:MAG: lytic murein transglycosylase, partial [Pseudoxanthomonas sp.]